MKTYHEIRTKLNQPHHKQCLRINKPVFALDDSNSLFRILVRESPLKSNQSALCSDHAQHKRQEIFESTLRADSLLCCASRIMRSAESSRKRDFHSSIVYCRAYSQLKHDERKGPQAPKSLTDPCKEQTRKRKEKHIKKQGLLSFKFVSSTFQIWSSAKLPIAYKTFQYLFSLEEIQLN